MKRPLKDLRIIGPFVEQERDMLEPDKFLVFEFEGEDWMINFENRERHKNNIQRQLKQPRGPNGDVKIRMKEKQWDGNELVKEYEDQFPVTMVQVGMLDVMDFNEAVEQVSDIVTSYISDNGGRVDEVYTVEV